MAKELTCPFCRNKVDPPEQEGVILYCHQNGGTCPQSVYMLVLNDPGMAQGITTGMALLEAELDQGRQLEVFEHSMHGFFHNGMVYDLPPEDADVYYSIIFARPGEAEPIFDRVN